MLGERKEMERTTKKAEIANAQYTHDIMISSWWEFHLICQNAVSYLPQKSRKTAWEESLMYQTWGSSYLFVILLIIFIDFMPFCGVKGSPKGIPGVVIFPSRWSLYLSLALCLDHLVDHHLSSERRAQQCTTRGAAEMGNSKFQKYFSLITSPLTSQVFPPPFNCDNNHHPMSGILSKSNHVLWTPPQLSNLLKKMLNK